MNQPDTNDQEEDKAEDGGCRTQGTVAQRSEREMLSRSQTVRRALNQDIEAMKRISDERVEEIASLTVLLDNLTRQHQEERDAIGKLFSEAVKRNRLYVSVGNHDYIGGIEELAKRLGEAQIILQRIISLVESVIFLPGKISYNTYTGQSLPGSDEVQSSLKVIFQTIHDAILRKERIEAAEIITKAIRDTD